MKNNCEKLALPINQLSEYEQYVEEILTAYFLDSMRPELEPERFQKTVISWAGHFIGQKIPATRLMEIYTIWSAAREPKEFIFPSSIIQNWQKMKETSGNQYGIHPEKVCVVYDGTKMVDLYNPVTKESKMQPCKSCRR